MDNFLLTNRCTKIRVKTSDNHTLKVFSVFYQHPALLNPDGWKVLENTEKILVDENTLWLLEKHVCEFGFSPKDGTILTCKITPKDTTDLQKHWDEMLDYCIEVKKDFAQFIDAQKADELTSRLDQLKLKSDSQPAYSDPATNGHTLGRIPEETAQTPPSKLDGGLGSVFSMLYFLKL